MIFREWFSAAPVVPSDTVDLPTRSLALVAGTAGVIKVNMARNGTAVVVPVVAGVVIHLVATRVYASGTTATGIVALY